MLSCGGTAVGVESSANNVCNVSEGPMQGMSSVAVPACDGSMLAGRPGSGSFRAVEGAVNGEDVDDKAFRSRVLESINVLNNEVAALKLDLRRIEVSPGPMPSHHVSTCTIYVLVLKNPENSLIGKSCLEALLQCQVLQYRCVKALPCPSFKVKIAEGDLHKALVMGNMSGCYVKIWRTSFERVAE